MPTASPPPDLSTRRAPLARVALLVAVAALALGLGLGLARRGAAPAAEAARAPRVTHDVVLEQVRAVAALATAEAHVRDVVTYEQTRRFATKRALVVVTGRVLAGVNLDRATADGGAEVRVDTAARRIRVELPPAELLAAEVTDVRTYDEQAGLLNPFTPADRDAVQRAARERVRAAGADLRVRDLAERNATTVLQTLLGRDGWTVEVAFRGRAAPVPSRAPTPGG